MCNAHGWPLFRQSFLFPVGWLSIGSGGGGGDSRVVCTRLLLSFEVKIKVKSWQIVIAIYSIFSILVSYRKCTMCYRHRHAAVARCRCHCRLHRRCRRRRRRVSGLSSSQFDAGLSFFVSRILWSLFHSCPTRCSATLSHQLCSIPRHLCMQLSPSDCRWPCKHDFNSSLYLCETPSVVSIIPLCFARHRFIRRPPLIRCAECIFSNMRRSALKTWWTSRLKWTVCVLMRNQ